MHELSPVVAINDVTKKFGSKTLWNGLSLEVYPGEVVCLVGQSGSGKTTLLNCVGFLEKFDTGTISVASEDVRTSSLRRKRRLLQSTVGFLFQFHALIDDWTVERNLRLAQAYVRESPADKASARAAALAAMGLNGMEGRRTYTLSGGEQQRVALARLSLKRPRLVLVDEPTSALDEENVGLVLGELRRLADQGVGILVSTHDPRVMAFADRTVTV